MTTAGRSAGGRGSILDRVLLAFAPVRAGEGGLVLLMAVNVFLLLTSYYIIKPVREALILADWGAEIKIYASAGQALLLVGIVPLYSRLAGLMNSRRLITTVLAFFAACLGLFYLLARAGLPVGIAFYLWVGVFNLMVVAQFWSFANDVYTPEAGKRLFAIIGFGMSSGAVFGSFITGRLIEPLGVQQLLLLAGVLLLVSLGLTRWSDTLARRSPDPGSPQPAVEPDAPLKGRGGFALVFGNRYLLMIGVMLILANLVNTTGEYILGARVKADQEAALEAIVRAPGMSEEAYAAAVAERSVRVGKAIGGFYADFFGIVNLVSMLTQLFLVARLVAWIGVRRAVAVLPLVAMGGYAVIALVPALAAARWAKTAENATDYSLQNTVRNMLFLPTNREEKYKAKQAIDTFFVRVGDVLAALLVLGGTAVLHLSPRSFAGINIVLASAWLVLALAIGRRFVDLSKSRSI
ncbi:translocase [bacterium]|nr:translocase [bacterium]